MVQRISGENRVESNVSRDWLNRVGKTRVQAFQDSFAKAFNIGLCFLDLDGKALTVWSNSSLFCCQVYQENKRRCQRERANTIAQALLNNGPQEYTCYMGRKLFLVPVIEEKRIMAVALGSLQGVLAQHLLESKAKEGYASIDNMIELLTNSLAFLSNNAKDPENEKKDKKDFSSSETFLMQQRISRRELRVVEKISQGLSNKEIASQLTISEATVKTHITNILHKLCLKDRIEIIIYLKQNNLQL